MSIVALERLRPHPAWVIAGAAVLLAVYGAASTPGLVMRWGVSAGGIAIGCGWLAMAMLAAPLVRRAPRRIEVALLVALALAIRVLVALASHDRAPAGDAMLYPELAANLIAGRGFEVYEPFIGSTLRALYPPVYPLLLAAWGAVAGFTPMALAGSNAIIDGIAAWLLGRLGTRLGNDGVGRGAAWLYLIWPSAVLSAPFAQKEGLCVILILALALGWLNAIERPGRWRSAAAIGLPAGLLALTQPAFAPLALLFGLVLVTRASMRSVPTTGIAAAAIAVVVMLPWWARNALVFGSFVPLTSAGPISLWIGNNPDATGNWVPTPPSLKGLPELAYAHAAGAMAWAWITGHPEAFVRLTITKFVRAAAVAQFGIVRLAAQSPIPMPALFAALFPVSQAAHLALLGGSAAALVRRSGVPPMLVRLIVACGLQMLLFGVWFEFGERHREFATPFLLLAVVMAASRWITARSATSRENHGRRVARNP